jgi:hypothetical protein
MNRNLLLACFAMLFASTSVMALDGKSCEAKSAQLKLSERDAFMKSCLAQLSTPANVKETQQQDKRVRCEQNAKNQNLQGNEKGNYITSCITENEAAAAAKAAPAQTEAKAAPAAKAKHVSAAASKPGISCAKQARKKGLKGDARKEFMKDCKPS